MSEQSKTPRTEEELALYRGITTGFARQLEAELVEATKQWHAWENIASIDNDRAEKAEAELAALTAQESAQSVARERMLMGLLKVASCPNCDGCGFTVRETGGCDSDGENDTREWRQEQCQWCVERDDAIRSEEKKT